MLRGTAEYFGSMNHVEISVHGQFRRYLQDQLSAVTFYSTKYANTKNKPPWNLPRLFQSA
jgi:hypothetical protein